MKQAQCCLKHSLSVVSCVGDLPESFGTLTETLSQSTSQTLFLTWELVPRCYLLYLFTAHKNFAYFFSEAQTILIINKMIAWNMLFAVKSLSSIDDR